MITKYFKYNDGSLIPKTFKDELDINIPKEAKIISKEEFEGLVSNIPKSSSILRNEEINKLNKYKTLLKTKFYKGNQLTDLQAKFLANENLSKLDKLNLLNEIENNIK